MNKRAWALVVIGALASGSANAVVIFSEDFEGVTYGGPLGGAAAFNSTEREGGAYYALAGGLLSGWTVVNPGQVFVHVGNSGSQSVLLNEFGVTSISAQINGLLPGVAHLLTFEYSGDNSGTAPYSFTFEINGVTTSVIATSTGIGTGNFNTVSFLFTPSTATTTLRFTETVLTGGSPVFDNIRIATVPEPGTLALLGLGLAGLGLSRRRKTH